MQEMLPVVLTGKRKEGFIGSDGEWCFPGGRSLSFDEMVRNGMEKMAET